MMNTSFKAIWPDWEIVRLIGQGSSGAVYEIERDVFGHKDKAALKVISIPQKNSDVDDLMSDGYDDASITRHFKSYLQDIVKEYSMMAEMKGCANIVYCDDVKYVQHSDGVGWDIFIKMELLTALPKAIGRTITDAQTIAIGKDICSALCFCEKHNVLHRDVKPQNIFVSSDGTYKLGDFGIAKTSERTSGGTKTGTYKYMAPEVFNNQPYGVRADIYSLGMVLYWLLNERRMPFLPLTPEPPTASEEERARARRFSGEPIPAPAHGNPELKRIVLKACAFDPNERYINAEEMMGDLERAGAAVIQKNIRGLGKPPIDVMGSGEETETVGFFGRRTKSCPACGKPLGNTDRFCPYCGADLSDAQESDLYRDPAPSVTSGTGSETYAAPAPVQTGAAERKDGGKGRTIAIISAVAAVLVLCAVGFGLWKNFSGKDLKSAASQAVTPASTAKPTAVPEKKTAAPKISAQPKSVSVNEGEKASFTVKASGQGLKYKWYYRENSNAKWAEVKVDGNASTYTVETEARHNGYQYKCTVTNSGGSATSAEATLSVTAKPKITKQPSDVSINKGAVASFKVSASGSGLKYQWYYLKPGEKTWNKVVSNGTAATYSVTTEERHDGYKYKCIVTNNAGSATSSTVQLSVVSVPKITKQPADASIQEGDAISFSVVCTGSGLKYQWYYCKTGESTWNKVVVGGTSANYTVTTEARHDGYKYRCVVSNSAGEVTSKTAKLTVILRPKIRTQPKDTTVSSQATAKFKVVASGNVTSYCWQYCASGNDWKNLNVEYYPSADKALLKLKAYTSLNGYRFRCIVTFADGHSEVSDSAKLTVK